MHPKVFISHASEDKDRFVLEFARKLRQEHGIDAWLDKWEMFPGDSLIDKIFEEGIKDASAVIVVLSKFSVQKPWVREELNAACVKRINHGSKLIPVIIDDCEVPEALKNTVWEKINDLSSYKTSLDGIVASIYGVSDKPPLGTAPAYTKSFVGGISGLSNLDGLILKLSCEDALSTGKVMRYPGQIFFKEGQSIIPEQELKDSLEILDRHGYISLIRTIAPGFFAFQITTFGFDAYANACIADYQTIVNSVVSALVNKQLNSNFAIAEELNQKVLLINHILDVLESNGHLKQAKTLDGTQMIFNMSPALRRSLNS